MASGRGSLKDTAAKSKSQSAMDRRGPSNPARQRQPKRLGVAGRLMASMKAFIGRSIKGPDLGQG